MKQNQILTLAIIGVCGFVAYQYWIKKAAKPAAAAPAAPAAAPAAAAGSLFGLPTQVGQPLGTLLTGSVTGIGSYVTGAVTGVVSSPSPAQSTTGGVQPITSVPVVTNGDGSLATLNSGDLPAGGDMSSVYDGLGDYGA